MKTQTARRFAALILTHGRPDNVVTYQRLRKHGYTGRILVVLDDEDKTQARYRELYGADVRVFSKAQVATTFDEADNFQDRRAIVYARNAAWDVAQAEGLTHFIQLDDDYTEWRYRYNPQYARTYKRNGDTPTMYNLDAVIEALCDYLDATPLATFAMAQGGDFIGGEVDLARGRHQTNTITFLRKAMNSFICRVDRRFTFVGRINEDVNTYTSSATRGLLMGSTSHVSLSQGVTQQNTGGMTEIYQSLGTYVKSYYSVIFHPSGVTLRMLPTRNKRLHHLVNWDRTAPKIVRESLRKLGDTDKHGTQRQTA